MIAECDLIFTLVATPSLKDGSYDVSAVWKVIDDFKEIPILLDEKSLVKILKEPKNSLIKQYQRLFEFENVQLEFKDEAVLEIAKKAISKKTGARGLRSILENILLKTMFELPDMENVMKVTVDSQSVKGKSEPIVTYGKKTSTSVA